MQKKARVTISENAQRELRGISGYIALRNPLAAQDVRQRIRKTIGQLAYFPQLGHPGRVAQTRELGVPGLPYLIIYKLESREIAVAHIRHTSMRWPPGEDDE